jgi:acyl dehydratase
MREIEQRGLYYDEFETDVKYLHRPGRTVTEADNVLFTTLTMNTQALHLDAFWSETQEFGQRLVNSMFTLSTVVGLSVAQLTQGTIVANLGFSEVAFPHPVYHGDTLYAETTVMDKRLSASRPGQGIVTLSHLGRNQRGQTVVRAIRTTLVWTEEGHAKQMADGPETGPVTAPES